MTAECDENKYNDSGLFTDMYVNLYFGVIDRRSCHINSSAKYLELISKWYFVIFLSIQVDI